MKNLLTLIIAVMAGQFVYGQNPVQKMESDQDIQQTVPAGIVKFNSAEKFFTAGSNSKIYGRAFPIDRSKKYRLAGTFRNVGDGKSGPLYFGFALFDADGMAIAPEHVNAITGSETELAAAARKGDRVLKLADASKWNGKLPASKCAFNIKRDFSDLPNRSVVSLKINSLKKTGEVWEVTLEKPLAADYPAGCAVRQHQSGAGMYAAAFGARPGAEWKTYSGVVRNGLMKPGNAANQWWVGAKYASILIMPNFGQFSGKIEFKDIVLEITD